MKKVEMTPGESMEMLLRLIRSATYLADTISRTGKGLTYREYKKLDALDDIMCYSRMINK